MWHVSTVSNMTLLNSVLPFFQQSLLSVRTIELLQLLSIQFSSECCIVDLFWISIRSTTNTLIILTTKDNAFHVNGPSEKKTILDCRTFHDSFIEVLCLISWLFKVNSLGKSVLDLLMSSFKIDIIGVSLLVFVYWRKRSERRTKRTHPNRILHFNVSTMNTHAIESWTYEDYLETYNTRLNAVDCQNHRYLNP